MASVIRSRRLVPLFLLLAASPVLAQRYVSMKPSNRPWTDHPFQACRDGVFSDYQTSIGRVELTIQEMKRAGVEMARLEIPWLNLEPAQQGKVDWRRVDHVVDLMERYQIELLPIFLSCPLSSGSGLTGKMHPACAPDLERFALAFFDRYYPRVQYAEICNEPGQIYWVEDFGWGGSNYAYYRELLVPVSVAIKARYPNVKVINGGTLRVLPYELFWDIMIPALGRTEKPIDHIDAFSVHYVETVADFQAHRAELDRQGYPHIEIWNTECDYFDNWAGQPWGYTSLVNQTVPNLVARHFDYTDVNGWQYHIDPITGYRFETPDDGGILSWDFDHRSQSYLDFTNASGGPYDVDSFAPACGVAFTDFEVISKAPNATWTRDLGMFNLGPQAHTAELSYSHPGLGPATVPLAGKVGHHYGTHQLSVSGQMPASGSDRVLVLARSRAHPDQADLTRLTLRGAKGAVLNGSASYAPRFAAALDNNPGTSLRTDGYPTDIELQWPSGPVRLEQIGIDVGAGDNIDTACSFVELEFHEGGKWLKLGSLWAKEHREFGGPVDWFTCDDGESIESLPFTAQHIRLRFWQKARIKDILIRGEAQPGDTEPRCHIERVNVQHPDPGWQEGWALEGWVYDPQGLDQPGLTGRLEWNGPNEILVPLIFADLKHGPLSFFEHEFVGKKLFRFRFSPWPGFFAGQHSFVLRVHGQGVTEDFDLATVR